MKDESFDNLSKNAVATWLHWMRELVRRGKAELKQGNIDQTVPGRIRLDNFNQGPTYKDQHGRIVNPKYLDEFEMNAEYEPATSA